MFSIFKKKPIQFFSAEEQDKIVLAIQSAEKHTSGEIRVFIESHCRFMDPVDRALEIFGGLQMDKTVQHNGVLVYIAVKDRQLAIFGDEGIHQKLGQSYWDEEVTHILNKFNAKDYVEGLVQVVEEIGQALAESFPYDASTDKNELPDDLVFGH